MGIKTKKQRKISKVTETKCETAGSSEENLICVGQSQTEKDVVSSGSSGSSGSHNVISMESMVSLPDPALSPLYVDAITKLKAAKYKEAVESLLKVIRYFVLSSCLPVMSSYSYRANPT